MYITINKDFKDLSLEAFLRDVLHLPRKTIHQLRMDKTITINDQVVPFSYSLQTDDFLTLPVTDIKSSYQPNASKFIDVLYEDNDCLIVVKPYGMKTHPNEPDEHDTLLNYLIDQCNCDYLEPVHRLDKDTSGVILIAKNSYMKAILDYMLAERKIKRTYLAMVDGIIEETMTINAPIGKDRSFANKRRVSDYKGQEAITHIVKVDNNGKYSIIELELETGRTHQIRVHLSHIGHPIVGDRLYNPLPRGVELKLISYKIDFVHPITLKMISAQTPITFSYQDRLLK